MSGALTPAEFRDGLDALDALMSHDRDLLVLDPYGVGLITADEYRALLRFRDQLRAESDAYAAAARRAPGHRTTQDRVRP